MSEKYFLVKMDDQEWCFDSVITQSSSKCCRTGKRCTGDLQTRPKFCPLVPVRKLEKAANIMNKEVWVEE